MADPHSILRDEAFMRDLLDLVIPPSADGRMPSAGSLGLVKEVADALEGDDQLGALVEAGCQAVHDAAIARAEDGFASLSEEERLALVEEQMSDHPALIEGLIRHLYVSYYQHPTVLEGIGEPARPPFPLGFDVEATDPALLATLHERQRTD